MRPTRANGTETTAARNIAKTAVATMTGSQSAIVTRTLDETLRPMLAPMVSWPNRRPASGAISGSPAIAAAAVATSGPRIQARGTWSL
jgi:hypothetical protein